MTKGVIPIEDYRLLGLRIEQLEAQLAHEQERVTHWMYRYKQVENKYALIMGALETLGNAIRAAEGEGEE